MLKFTGERIVPGADNCEPTFAQKMYQEHVARYAFAAAFAPGADVLDVGCGVGYGSNWLARAGARSVVAIDIAEDAIAHAKKAYFDPAITYKVCSASSFSFPAAFDLVTCFELIEHVVEQEAVLDNIADALRPGGVLVISTPRPLDDIRTHFHHHELELEELFNLLKSRFKNVKLYFENNYFTSYVGAQRPEALGKVIPVTEQFGLSTADYFVFAATNGDSARLDLAQPVLTMNDDAYILTLENDVSVLRRAEDDAKARIIDLEREAEGLKAATAADGLGLDEARGRVQALESQAERLRAELQEQGALHDEDRRALERSAEAAQSAGADLRTAAERIGELKAQAADLRSEIDAGTVRHGEALAAVEQALTQKQAALAKLQRESSELKAEIERARSWDAAQSGALATARGSLAATSARVAEVETALFNQVSQTRGANAVVDDLRASLSAAQATVTDRQIELTDRNDLLQVQAEHLLRLHDEVGLLIERDIAQSEERAQLSARLAESGRQIEALSHQNDDLASTLRRFRTSVSWAVTRPIRWTGRMWKRLARGDGGRLRLMNEDHGSPMSDNPAQPASASQPDILFIIGCWEGESKRYRVYNVVEGLTAWGYSCEIVDFGQCASIIERNLRPKIAVFFRAPFDPNSHVTAVLEYFRLNSVRTVFDVDDYVFEPKIVGSIAGVSDFSPEDRRNYEWGVRAYRSLLFFCDRATVSTPYLADRMTELGREVAVVSNTVNAAQKARAVQLLAAPREVSETVRICYFSGSRTHAKDFQECAAAIQAILRKNKKVIFRLVGLLDLDKSWDAFAERIERSGFLTPLDMLDSLSQCSINVAPLEEGNVFCEGKSELKYFEAGLVQIPTVASRTVTYAAAIKDDVDGYLASGQQEWESKLQILINSAALRHRIGVAARKVALSRFSADAAAKQALVAYGLEQDDPIERVERADALKIGWIVPGLIIGSGGHRNILRAAYHLERFGHDVRLYFSDTNSSDSELRRDVRKHFYPFSGPVSRFEGRVEEEDVLMATHWSTVSLAESVRDQVGEIMYFVQDFEPAFYPMGSEYILAENTYRKGLYGISSGPWCERLLKDRYGMEVDHFRFPVDQDIYHVNGHEKRANRILFFAKPEMPRRCFLIGVSALRALHRLRPDVEIMFYGSASAQDYPLDFPVTFSGVLPGIEDLARLYATATLGMVFSTTNPSLVPYEMMAAGLPVVDIGVPGNEVNYDDRMDIALLADPDPVAMARQISDLLGDPDEIAARRARGVRFAASFPSEEQMAKRIEDLILARYNAGAGRRPTPLRAPALAVVKHAVDAG